MQPAKIPSYILDQSYMRKRRERRRKDIILAAKELAVLVVAFLGFYIVLYVWG